MSVVSIILLLLAAIVLLILEFFVIPGITLAGIAGAILFIWAVYAGFSTYGLAGGVIILSSAIVVTLGAFYFAFKANTWKRITLHASIDSKVSDPEALKAAVREGDEGKALSRLAPMGKVMVNNQVVEGRSVGDYISEGSAVTVVHVNSNGIIVKPL